MPILWKWNGQQEQQKRRAAAAARVAVKHFIDEYFYGRCALNYAKNIRIIPFHIECRLCMLMCLSCLMAVLMGQQTTIGWMDRWMSEWQTRKDWINVPWHTAIIIIFDLQSSYFAGGLYCMHVCKRKDHMLFNCFLVYAYLDMACESGKERRQWTMKMKTTIKFVWDGDSVKVEKNFGT